MGGHAFKTPCKRIATDEFIPFFEKIKAKLDILFPNVVCEYVPFDSNKKDHGDLDVLLGLDVADLQYTPEQLIEALGATDYLNSGATRIFRVDDYEVDIIFCKNIEFARMFYRSGGFGDVLGEMLFPFNLMLKDDGLYYRHTLPNETRTNVFVFGDLGMVMGELGLDYDKICNATTIDEVANVLVGSSVIGGLRCKIRAKNTKPIHDAVRTKVDTFDKTPSEEQKQLGFSIACKLNPELANILHNHDEDAKQAMERAAFRRKIIADVQALIHKAFPDIKAGSGEMHVKTKAVMDALLPYQK